MRKQDRIFKRRWVLCVRWLLHHSSCRLLAWGKHVYAKTWSNHNVSWGRGSNSSQQYHVSTIMPWWSCRTPLSIQSSLWKEKYDILFLPLLLLLFLVNVIVTSRFAIFLCASSVSYLLSSFSVFVIFYFILILLVTYLRLLHLYYMFFLYRSHLVLVIKLYMDYMFSIIIC